MNSAKAPPGPLLPQATYWEETFIREYHVHCRKRGYGNFIVKNVNRGIYNTRLPLELVHIYRVGERK